MPRDTATTDTPTVEIMRSPQLAAILTPLIMDMTREAATRYEAAGLARVMAAPLSAIRATVNEIRKVHGLPGLDRTGEPMISSDNGQAPAEPEPAEAKS